MRKIHIFDKKKKAPHKCKANSEALVMHIGRTMDDDLCIEEYAGHFPSIVGTIKFNHLVKVLLILY